AARPNRIATTGHTRDDFGTDGGCEICGAGASGCAASSISSRATPISDRRCFRSLARHLRNGLWIDGGVPDGRADQSGWVFSTAASVSETVSPSNSWRPVSSSYNTAPNAQMSARLSTAAPRACSGDMYAAVPIITPAMVARMVSVGEDTGSPATVSGDR